MHQSCLGVMRLVNEGLIFRSAEHPQLQLEVLGMPERQAMLGFAKRFEICGWEGLEEHKALLLALPRIWIEYTCKEYSEDSEKWALLL